MPRMMNTPQAAAALGISIKSLHRAIRKSGLRMTLTKSGIEYLFSPDDLKAVSEYLNKNHQRAAEKARDDSAGLPVEWLNDPAHAADFAAERYRREARLMARVRAVE